MSALAVSNIVLWLVVIGMALVLLALVRQVGVLHERIAPAGALLLAKGLKVGDPAPALTVADLGGRTVAIGGPRADRLSTLLMFVSPSCPVCKELLPVLKASRRSERSWLEIVFASDGDEAEQRQFVGRSELEDFPYIISAPLGVSYQVGRLPFAALIDDQGVLRARGIINSREHLESLFEAKRLGVVSLQEYLENAARKGAA